MAGWVNDELIGERKRERPSSLSWLRGSLNFLFLSVCYIERQSAREVKSTGVGGRFMGFKS